MRKRAARAFKADQNDVLHECIDDDMPNVSCLPTRDTGALTPNSVLIAESENASDLAIKEKTMLEDVTEACPGDAEISTVADGDGDTIAMSSISAFSDEDTSPAFFGKAESRKTSVPSESSDSDCSPERENCSSSNRDSMSSSPTSWSAAQRDRKKGMQENRSSAEIARAARALLNKLTEERFETLCTQLLALPVSTAEHLSVVVAEIFQKATTQHGFRALYTQLCLRFDAHFANQSGSIGGKAFRKSLVGECQATFERSLQSPDVALFEDLDEDEQFELELKFKESRLGNMRFIGDLLVRHLLAPKLLLPIVHQLLNSDEAALESLIALLMVVGPEFEVKPSLHQAPVREAFGKLRGKMSDKGVCARTRCQIQDLLDAKARAWAPRSCA
jgi:hypothetical protein